MQRKAPFTMKTIAMIAIQGLRRIEAIHRAQFVHNDIKPSNLLVGRSPEHLSTMYLVDFGLARRYIDDNSMHIRRSQSQTSFAGTLYFAAWRAHYGVTTARRDDLESFLYSLIWLATGTLPWMNSKLDIAVIGVKKKHISSRDLCRRLPREYRKFNDMIRRLSFTEAPNYAAMRQLFKDWLRNRNMKEDGRFDWVPT